MPDAPTTTETEYVILTSDGDGWRELGPVLRARSAEAAIRKVVEGTPDVSVVVAIPTRSWKPFTITTSTKTVTTLKAI
jgi:hypothetical protein